MLSPAIRLVVLAFGASGIATVAGGQTLSPFQASARSIFQQLIEINTTHSTGSTTKAAEALRARFLAAGFAPADVEIVGPPGSKNHNLLVRYPGTGARKPVVLLAHLDVVEARREDWTYDPFAFTEVGGFFYGRGTSDIKDGAATLVAALLRLKEEKFRPDRDLLLALTAGEESGGDYNGVAWLLEHRPEFRTAAFVLNTDSGDPLARQGKLQARMVQVAEKVAFNFQLEVTNPGGHSSLPVPENAIYRLAAGLVRLGNFRFPVHLSELTRTFFARSAALETGSVAADLAAVGRDAPDLEAADRLARSAFYNAMLRTTCVATTIEGGHAPNALPQRARVNVNCRMLPFESADTVEATIRRVIADSSIRVTRSSVAQTSPPSPLEGEFPALMAKVSAAMWPGVPVIPYMETGATDGLFFRNAGIPAYGASGVAVDPDDVRAHGKDERIGVEAFYQGAEHLYRLIRAVGTPP